MNNNLQSELLSAAELLSLSKPSQESWDRLASDSLETNPFYERWFFSSSLRHLAEMKNCEALVVRDGGKWVGFFPLFREKATALRLKALRLTWNVYAPLSAPLVSTERTDEVLEAFTKWVGDESDVDVLLAGNMPAEGVLRDKLTPALAADGARLRSFNSHKRALLRPAPGIDGESYIRALYNSKRRRDQRARERGLAEHGRVSFVELVPSDDLTPWIRSFLELESAGWKGQKGGAFKRVAGGAEFLSETLSGAHREGKLDMLALRLDNRDIGLKINFRSGRKHFSWKIAYDERYASFSPGVILELQNIRRFVQVCARGEADWMDSLAIPDHPMIDRLWTERRPVESLRLPLTTKARAGLALLDTAKSLIGRATA